jgi:hypothetical protein
VRDRQRAPGGAHGAVERKLAEQSVRAQLRVRQLAACCEDRAREREVERGSGLGEVGGCEVGCDPASRKLKARVADRRVHALARLAHGSVGEAHDRKSGQAGADVDLDGHMPCLQAVECEGMRARKQELERATLAAAWDATLRRTPRSGVRA